MVLSLGLSPLAWAQADLGLSGVLQPNTASNPFAAENMPAVPGADTAAKQPAISPAQPKGQDNPLLTQDHLTNQASDVFGAQLFTGAFSQPGATQFNPDYAVTLGDQIQVRLWGAFTFDQVLTVDPRGNIFLPHAGPVQVLGVRNQDLEGVVQAAVRRTFRNNVSSYASLAAAQPVRVFVGGNVNRPGLYNGTSMDSILRYLDMAGGVDPERGSYLQVQVKRGQAVRATISLYDFLLNGTMPMVQLADGDVIFVPSHAERVKVGGLVANAKRFEFQGQGQTVAQLMQLAKPLPDATHVRVMRNTGSVRNAEYYPLSEAANVQLIDGDELQFTADKKPGTITVRIEGEHDSAQEYVLPYGTVMGSLLEKIQLRQDADMTSVQLYRESVKQRQKEMLATSLHNGRDGFLRRRKKGRKIINLWHGVAIKRIEHLMRWRLGDFKRRYLMRRNSHLYHAMIASSPLDRLTNAVSFGVDLDKVYAIGLPRFDYLRSDFSFSWRLKKDIERLSLALSGRRLILFAPTFRERRGQAISFLNSETLEKLKIFLQKNNFVFGIRPHPYDQDGLDEICDDNWIVNISPDKFIEPAIALRAADILIADYSSIWIDFLLLDRPMIGVMPDYKNYADRERGFIFDIFDVFPGPIIFDWSLVFIYLEKIVNSYALFAAEYFGKYQRAKNLFLPSEGLVFHSTNACLELFFNND